MSGRDELVERIARAIIADLERGYLISNSSFDYDVETGCVDFDGALQPIEIARSILPIIDAEIAAERERCAAVVDAEVVKFAKSALPTMPKLKAALKEYLSIIAAAIRSQP